MTPVEDSRPFKDVLREWITRHGGSAYAVSRRLPVSAVAIRKWLSGAPCPHDRAYRALMTLIDEDRA